MAYAENTADNKSVSDTISLSEIKVTATMLEGTLKSLPGSASVLTNQQLDAFNPINIAEQLNSLPGVFVQSGTFNTNRIVIRGIGSRTPYSTNRIKAYLNDIPLTNGDGVTTLEDIDVTRLGRIEVMKGPNSALYGSGLGGTIKLITDANESFFNSRIQYGSFNTMQSKLASGFALGNAHISASVHHTHTDGFRENSLFNKYSGILTANQNWTQTNVQFTLFVVNMKAQIPSSINKEMFLNSPEKAAPNWLAANGREENQQLLSGITINHRFSERVSNKITLFAGISNSFEHRPFNDLNDESANYGIRSQMKYHRAKLDAISGIELYSEQYSWSTSLDENGEVATLAQVNENRKYANFFVLANYSPLSAVKLSAGFNLNRLNYLFSGNDTNNESFNYPYIFSPRFGFNYEPSSNLNYYGSVGHGFSAPSLEETLMPNGEKNPDLKPETGWMSEVGIRFANQDNSWFVDACIYSIALNNLLVTKRISEENFMGVNAGKTNHIGFELQTEYSFFHQRTFPGSLILDASATLSRNWFVKFEDEGIDYAGNELPGIPAQTLSVGIKWNPLKTVTLNVHQSYFGNQFLNDANTESYSGVYLLNLNLKFQLNIQPRLLADLTFGVNNAFNKNYASMILVNAPTFGSQQPRYYYPGVPQNWYLAISFYVY